ncbi:uncharacterized protein EV154DRAFT_563942 [Mucor mucedo]|uniref:uncharacterized protein n=1 Tax=Mucor mucedo TaxID=29922 RepID=UPI0022203DDF|nr:uncharacterized protein EV154DRAFT_563942 [Mucor mucedo]KAI7890808.1 hypothetical protein EV154DRAFT_563942 [Mucor mucedo]
MPRNRSLSASSNPAPPLISRGFASLRRAHRRLSNSSPTSPIIAPSGDTTTVPPLDVNTTEASVTRPNGGDGDHEAVITHPRIRLVPNVGLSNRSFVFDIIDRELQPGLVYRIGRFSDRSIVSERLSFKSKVVSRNHAEIWTEQRKIFIRDIGSSSGTFLNRCRLSPPNHVSEPYELKDGDTIQLGVDYQGGVESIYRAVRIRVEINRQIQNPNSPFARTAFQQLRNHLIGSPINNITPSSDATASPTAPTVPTTDLGLHREPTKVHEHSADIAAPDSPKQVPLSDLMSRHHITEMDRADIQECCICLYAIAPFQALFIAPCSHIFHFKCLRPIVFQNYPGFSCPLCRNYFDLEASVAVEVDEVLEAISIAKEQQKQEQSTGQVLSPIDTVPEVNEDEEREHDDTNRLDVTAESSLHPSSNHSEQSDNDEEQIRDLKNRSGSPAACANNDENTSQPQAIEANDNHASPAHTRLTRSNEALLSTTLVGSPAFQNSPLVAQNNNSNAIS